MHHQELIIKDCCKHISYCWGSPQFPLIRKELFGGAVQNLSVEKHSVIKNIILTKAFRYLCVCMCTPLNIWIDMDEILQEINHRF